MGLKIKVPVKEIGRDNVYEKVKRKLMTDADNAYTVSGLVIEIFNVNKKQIENKPFRDWPAGLPTVYSRIRTSLNKLVKQNLVKTTKHGRAWVYWWVDKTPLGK